MDPSARESAERMRGLLLAGKPPGPAEFRAALLRVAPSERDAFVDHVLRVDAVPDDGPELPRGCVPYLPCAVDALLRVVDLADIDASDVFVDVGAGVGRATALVHLLTGASAVGLEIQPALVRAARELAARSNLSRVSVIEGDAAELTRFTTVGSVFFFYCPFGRERLERVLDDLDDLARVRPIRVCTVDLPLPDREWLAPESPSLGDVAVYRSTLLHHPSGPFDRARRV